MASDAMTIKFRTLLLLLFLSQVSYAQERIVRIFQTSKKMNNLRLSGTASYDEETQVYTIKGAGTDSHGQGYNTAELYQKLKGDFILTANFEFVEGHSAQSKIGWMARASEAKDADTAGAFLYGDGLTKGEWHERRRTEVEHPRDNKQTAESFYQVIQLERSGDRFTVRAARPGEALQEISSKTMGSMPREVLAGIMIGSQKKDEVAVGRVWNLRIDQPVPNDYDPSREGWIGCRLETMNVFDGKRKVIYEKKDRFEAPNWMMNGKELLFNMDGLLYTIPAEGGPIELLDTGFANNLNNDHCISFNGEKIGISHDGKNGSKIYYLPTTGGTPTEVTKKAPSYLHGWAPNNEEVVYVATREGNKTFDIYRQKIAGGEEERLTDTKENEHVDGCEYSPDGKYIYYNGSKNGGSMQLWRMKPDGSQKEQLTFDEYNDWFPHISPDGKWIAFISFPQDIELNSHPSFKRVMLRIMPASGGAPKVIAHLYGGQGTINVNSWSPDSKHIAFVSNSAAGKAGKND